ncbi:MAG: polyamine aminopropyltransferase [Bdellovibrionales bacterium]|nr:polyamine aminopropyltransferase [Bdellovibrionales bacterium]
MAHIHKVNGQDYVIEIFEDHYLQGWKLEKELLSKKSKFQQVDVVKTKSLGNMLLNDNLVMTSDRDEFAYHEMMAHVPLFTHPDPKNVLIIGGGDGGTAREVLRHKSVASCVMVEIDEVVVEACKEFIPTTSNELDNSRLELLIDDGVKYVAETNRKFDVVLVDSTDPIGPGAPLFGEEFYKNVKRLLNPKGVVVSQAESGWYLKENQQSLLSVLKNQFKNIGLYNYSNITYPGGLWSFSWASDELHPIHDFNERRVAESGLDFKYYNSKLHTAAFCLPQFYYNSIGEYINI